METLTSTPTHSAPNSNSLAQWVDQSLWNVKGLSLETLRPTASGLRPTVYNLFSLARARLTLARISLADAVQMKGLGQQLCSLMYS